MNKRLVKDNLLGLRDIVEHWDLRPR
jgi:hypothetical protein